MKMKKLVRGGCSILFALFTAHGLVATVGLLIMPSTEMVLLVGIYCLLAWGFYKVSRTGGSLEPKTERSPQ
jgi:hypothetical protein